jgi:hypothetical protein
MVAEFRLAFVARNEFMFLQIEKLWRSYAGAHVLLVGAMADWDEFLARQEASERHLFRQVNFRDLVKLDGSYDAIFIQTPFPLIERLNKSRLISVQYGLAKERHNYGVWRSLADLNLMYGPYSAHLVSHFSPAVAVGNLKFAGVNLSLEPEAKKQLALDIGLDQGKKTLLYMPTYRELGSFERLVKPLSHLRLSYNVVIKMHHNQESDANFGWREHAKSLGFEHLFGAGADQAALLAVSDVVVSDFSGAIFDALYARKPVVLYQEGAAQLVGTQKFDLDSLEYRRRHELGIICETPLELAAAVEAARQDADLKTTERDAIRQELMIDGGTVDLVGAARQAVDDLLHGRLEPLSKTQLYVREMCKSARDTERRLAAAEKRRARPFWQRILKP